MEKVQDLFKHKVNPLIINNYFNNYLLIMENYYFHKKNDKKINRKLNQSKSVEF